MRKKEMVAMLLAGGQGSRLGILTKNKAKPAVAFGGKYRIIDFPLSNCINSGVETVGVLTQYRPRLLNRHIGIGMPWDLDRMSGGVSILAPHVKGEHGEWYSGTANAIYQNADYINEYNPDYVLILSGDHIYKMDYSDMLAFHKKNNCDATIAVLEVPIEEASRFGIMNTRDDDSIYEFDEKPAEPKSNLASMGIYIFTWDKLRDALASADKQYSDSDFGKHIIPMMLSEGRSMYAYRFKDYWKDVGTVESYWAANMELIGTLPEFNLYDDFWRIYTSQNHQPPVYMSASSEVSTSIVSEGCEIYGKVFNSVIGADVVIEEGAVVRDSIIQENCRIGKGAVLNRCILDENTFIGEGVVMGEGENMPNIEKPNIYDTGITVTGENTTIPDGIKIGKNCVISGTTLPEHYIGAALESGGTVIIEEEEALK